MKLHELKKAGAKAQQDFELAEGKAKELEGRAKAAKAKAEQARLEHKRARKAAKQAKKVAVASEEQAREKRRKWEKAQKRLRKALQKLARTNGGKAKHASKPAVKKPARQALKAEKPVVASQSPPAAAGAEGQTPASPTV